MRKCYISNIMTIDSSYAPLLVFLFSWPLILTSKSSILQLFFSLPLFLASRCHDLLGSRLNRLAIIKSYAPLMTLSWAQALVLWGKEIGMKIGEGLDAERRGKGWTTDKQVGIWVWEETISSGEEAREIRTKGQWVGRVIELLGETYIERTEKLW